MKKFSKKLVALFVAMMMVSTCIPSSVFAVDVATDSTSASTEIAQTGEETATGSGIGGNAELFETANTISVSDYEDIYTDNNNTVYTFKHRLPVYVTATGKEGDKVALYKENELDHYVFMYVISSDYVSGGTYDIKAVGHYNSGNTDVSADLPVGKYVISVISENEHVDTVHIEVVRNSDPATANDKSAVVELDKDVYSYGEPVHIFGYGDNTGGIGADDWFAVFRVNEDIDNTPVAGVSFNVWSELGDIALETADQAKESSKLYGVSSTMSSSGYAVFDMYGDGARFHRRHVLFQSQQLTPGIYEVRYFTDAGTTNTLKVQKYFEVRAVATDKKEYDYGEDITISMMNPYNEPFQNVTTGNITGQNDFIGIWREDRILSTSSDSRYCTVKGDTWIYRLNASDLEYKQSAVIQTQKYNGKQYDKNGNQSNISYNLPPGKYKVMYFKAENEATQSWDVVEITINGTSAKFGKGAYQVDNLSDGFANGTVAVATDAGYSALATKLNNDETASSGNIAKTDRIVDCELYWADDSDKLSDYGALARFPITSQVTTSKLYSHTIIPEGATGLHAHIVLNDTGESGDSVAESDYISIDLPKNCEKYKLDGYKEEIQVVGNTKIAHDDSWVKEEDEGHHFALAVEDNYQRGKQSGQKSKTLIINGNVTDDGGVKTHTNNDNNTVDAYENASLFALQLLRTAHEDDPDIQNVNAYEKFYTAYGDTDRDEKGNIRPAYTNFSIDMTSNENDTGLVGEYSDAYHSHDTEYYRLIFMGTDANHDISGDVLSRFAQEMEELRNTSDKPVLLFISDPMEDTVSGAKGNTDTSYNIDNHDPDGVKENDKMDLFKNYLRMYDNLLLFSGNNSTSGHHDINAYELNNEYTFHAGTGFISMDVKPYHTIPAVQVSGTAGITSTYRSDSSSSIDPNNNNNALGISHNTISQGFYVRIYEDSIVLLGRDFTNRKYLPSACFALKHNNLEKSPEKITLVVNDDDKKSATIQVKDDNGNIYDASKVSFITNELYDEKSGEGLIALNESTGEITAMQEGVATVYITAEPTDSTVVTRTKVLIRVAKYGDLTVIKSVTDENGNNLMQRDNDDYEFVVKAYDGNEADNFYTKLNYTVTDELGATELKSVAYNKETGATITLKGGDTAVINNALLGDKYEITENIKETQHVSNVTTKLNEDQVNSSIANRTVTIDSFADGDKVEFINKLKPATVTLKYYDRTSVNGKPIDLNSTASTYTKKFYGLEIPHTGSDVDTEELLVKTGAALEAENAKITNILDDYTLFTSQEKAKQDIATETNLHTGTHYGSEEYHTNQYGYTQENGKWQDGRGSIADREKWVEISDGGLTVGAWMFNKPKTYDVKAYGVDSAEPTGLTKLSNGYYANIITETESFKAYYNQRPGGETDTNDTVTNYLGSYGISDYVDNIIDTQKQITFKNEELKFLYWSFDNEGKTVASTEWEYNYRIADDTNVYAIYGDVNAELPKGVTALENVTDYYSNGTTNYVRFNLVMNPYGYKDSYSIDGGYDDPDGITDVAVVYVRKDNNATSAELKESLVNYIANGYYDDRTSGTKSGTISNCKFNALQYEVVKKGTICTNDQITLTNKNRVQFSTSFKSTNVQGNTFYAYVMMKVDDEWVVSDNAVTYMN